MQTRKRFRDSIIALLVLLALPAAVQAQVAPASPLLQPGLQLSDPAQREQVAAALLEISTARRTAAREHANALGLPVEWTTSNGRRHSLAAFDGNRPLYRVTHNVNEGITTGANLLQAEPYNLTGTNFTIGLWDAGSARSTHQELAGRVTLKNSASLEDHSTHVAGILIASGVIANAKGMAPQATIDSYDWTSDIAEMTTRAATYPGEAGKLYISNQSYGFGVGWDYVGTSSYLWQWDGSSSSATSVDSSFGRYDAYARSDDALAFAAPYFLMFRSAGNDREDNPTTGDRVLLNNRVVTYDPNTMPKGDGLFHNGFETVSSDAVAKNIVSVGSVGDAVANGLRDVSRTYMSDYSCWGPTDDGRIKPDLVADGEGVYSSISTTDTSYDTYSGTSMASPNAAGSAMLLVQLYDRLHPGQVMRASTLKALLIQTADDLGNPGPDYRYGWGLVNVKAAADLLSDQYVNPGKRELEENLVSTAATSRTVSLTWDGVSPIRATLCWTDPAGAASSATDNRTSELVNDLDLHLVGPDGTIYRPFVMPFVGDWSVAAMDAPATTGINHTDNVEQVLISAPPAAGTYQVVVDYTGTLTNGQQIYSLVTSGGAVDVQPPPVLSAISTSTLSGSSSLTPFTATGTGFETGASIAFTSSDGTTLYRPGSLQFTSESISSRVDGSQLPAGIFDVTVTNPDGQSSTLPAAITISAPLWTEDFESGSGSWKTSLTTGSTQWSFASTGAHGGIHSFRGSGPGAVNLANLTSPAIAIPGNGTALSFSFWQSYGFNSSDCGVVEFSLDAGTTWTDVAKSGSGLAFTQNGYNGTISSNSSNPLAGRSAFTSSTSGYVQSTLSMDSAIFAGKSVMFRWRYGTNSNTASNSWYLDDLALNGKLATLSFDQWEANRFSDLTADPASATADPDGDGLTNLAEYALGTDPNVANAGPVLTANADGSATLSFSRPLTVTGVVYHAEISSDLITWTEVPITVTGTTATTQSVQAIVPAGLVNGFVRLRFEQ